MLGCESDPKGEILKTEAFRIPERFGSSGPTANNFGMIVHTETRLIKEWISGSKGKFIVDIGCGTGDHIISALKNGALGAIGIDLSAAHIKTLVLDTPAQLVPLLKVEVSRFPSHFNLLSNSVDSILTSHLFHYLSPQEIKLGLQKIFDALKPGGKVFIQSMTIFGGLFQMKRHAGPTGKEHLLDPDWPDYPFFFDEEPGLPKIGHPQDLKILTRELDKIGFKQINGQTYFVNDSGTWTDQPFLSDVVGIIAVKP